MYRNKIFLKPMDKSCLKKKITPVFFVFVIQKKEINKWFI